MSEIENLTIISRTNKQKLLNNLHLLQLKQFPDGDLPFSHVNTAGLLQTYGTRNISRLDLLFSFLLLNKILIMSVSETHLRKHDDIRGISISSMIGLITR